MSKLQTAAILLLSLTVTYCGGCLFSQNSYTPVKYYALRQPRPNLPDQINIQIANITTTGTSGTKMVFRRDQYHIIVDEYNHWVNPPAVMLNTFLHNSFSHQAASKIGSPTYTYILNANIFSFIADIDSKTVTLGVNYSLTRENKTVAEESLVIKIPLQHLTPDGYVNAMSQAAAKLAEHIRRQIKAVTKEKH